MKQEHDSESAQERADSESLSLSPVVPAADFLSSYHIDNLITHPEWIDVLTDWLHREWLAFIDLAAFSPTQLEQAKHNRRAALQAHLHLTDHPHLSTAARSISNSSKTSSKTFSATTFFQSNSSVSQVGQPADTLPLQVSDLHKVLQKCGIFSAEAEIRSHLPTTLVAHQDGVPVGGVSLVRYGDSPSDAVWVTNLFVLPNWRSQGIGKALMCECETLARQLQIHQLKLCTLDASDYYEKQGWHKERVTRLWQSRVDILSKTLESTA